jgi:hypothetical protein
MPASREGNGAQASLRGMTAIIVGSIQGSMHDVYRQVWHASVGVILQREAVRKWERWIRPSLLRPPLRYWPRDVFQG